MTMAPLSPSANLFLWTYKRIFSTFLILIFFQRTYCTPSLPEIVYPVLRHTTQKFMSSTASTQTSEFAPSSTSSLSASPTLTSKTTLAMAHSEELNRRKQSRRVVHGEHGREDDANASREVVVESDAWPKAQFKNKTEIRRSQSSLPDSNVKNSGKNDTESPMLIVASSAENGSEHHNAKAVARIIGAATDEKGTYIFNKRDRFSNERIDGDSDGDTISSKSFLQSQKNNEVPRLSAGRSIVDVLNSEELRRTTMRELKDNLSSTTTSLTTPTVLLSIAERDVKRARAHAVALKTPEFVRPKNMELRDEPKSLHLISYDTGEEKVNTNEQKSDTLALHSAKTLTYTLPLERPKLSNQQRQSQPDQHPHLSKSSITLAEMEKMRERLRSAANANRRQGSASHENTSSESRAIHHHMQQHPNKLILPPQPLAVPFIPALGSVMDAQPSQNRRPGEPDHTILPPLLTPPPMFLEGTTKVAADNLSGKANGDISPPPTREKTNVKRRRLNSLGVRQTAHPLTLPKVDESDFDLLMPPKAQPELPVYYVPQQIVDPNHNLYINDPILRPQSSNSILTSNFQQPILEYSTMIAPSLTAFIPANVLNPNAKLDLCCKKQGVSQSCQSLCNFDTFTDKSLVNAVLHGQCPGPELGKAFDCATSKVDHSVCCRRAGIDTYSNGQCMPFCQTHVPTPPNIFNYVACLQVFDTIKNCYKDYQLTSPNIYGD